LNDSWFQRNGLSATEIVAICKVLQNNTCIQFCSLAGNAAGKEGGEAIAEMIENNYTITSLNISCTE